MIGAGLIGWLLGFIISFLFIRHPFLSMIEGDGNIVFYMQETGGIQPYIVRPVGNYLVGATKSVRLEGVVTRSILNYLSPPAKANSMKNDEENKLMLEIPYEQYRKAKFSLEGVGVFFYSEKLKNFITKEMLAELNNKTFAEYMITAHSYKVRDLDLSFREFARHYVDLHKPNKPIWEEGWFKLLLVIVAIAIAAYLLYPYILKAIASSGDITSGLTAPQTKLR